MSVDSSWQTCMSARVLVTQKIIPQKDCIRKLRVWTAHANGFEVKRRSKTQHFWLPSFSNGHSSEISGLYFLDLTLIE
jgi:hypothetical protein